jgi:phage baseplate assembly protein W
LKNQNAIIRSIRNLVETIPTERFFNSTIGSNVRSSLFDFVDFGTASTVRDQIITCIQNYEPRVTDVIVDVDPRPDTNEFEVTVTFNIIGQEIPTQQFSFILEATR